MRRAAARHLWKTRAGVIALGAGVGILGGQLVGCGPNRWEHVAAARIEGKYVVCLDLSGSVVDSLPVLLQQVRGELTRLPLTAGWNIGVLPITGHTGVTCTMIDTCTLLRSLQSRNREVIATASTQRAERIDRMLGKVQRWCEDRHQELVNDPCTCIMETVECALSSMGNDTTLDRRILIVSDMIEECPSEGVDMLRQPASADSLAGALRTHFPYAELGGIELKAIVVAGSPKDAARASLGMVRRCQLWEQAMLALGATKDATSIGPMW